MLTGHEKIQFSSLSVQRLESVHRIGHTERVKYLIIHEVAVLQCTNIFACTCKGINNDCVTMRFLIEIMFILKAIKS